MILVDCHTHTENSPDAQDSIFALCDRAMELGLLALAVTEHCEADKYYSLDHYNVVPAEYDSYNFKEYFEKAMASNMEAKERYDGRLNFISGIELGQATHDFEVAEKIVFDKRLDFVIGSMHQLPNHDDFAFINYEGMDIKALQGKYFEEVLKLSKWGKFDVLGHLTYTLRYIEGNAGIKVDMQPFEEIIREIFKVIIQSGKGIEINTSGLRQKYGKSFPDLNYVKLYRELGGEILTIGSDSHRTVDLAKGVKEGIEIAKQAGFKNICYFKERKPQFIEI